MTKKRSATRKPAQATARKAQAKAQTKSPTAKRERGTSGADAARTAGNAKRGTQKSARALTSPLKSSGRAESARASNSVKNSVGKSQATAKKSTKKTTTKTQKAVARAKPVSGVRAVKAKPAPRVKVKAPTRRTVDDETTGLNVAPTSAMAEAMFADMVSEDAALEREAAREERMREIQARLAVSTNRYDEMPNLELAADIVFNLDREAVGLLIEVLSRRDDVHGPDAGRVLAEVATRDPSLVETHLTTLIGLIDEEHKDMLSPVMCALSPLAHLVVGELWDFRDLLWQVVNEGQEEADAAQAAAVQLLSALCAAGPDYARTLAGGLVDLLGKCLPRDVALYAEAVLPALGSAHSHRAKPVLDRRMKELTPAEVARLRRAVRMAQSGAAFVAAA